MAIQLDLCCENDKEECKGLATRNDSPLKTWLESINFGDLFETLNRNDIWRDLSIIKEINTEDKSLDGLIDDLKKSNIELGKPQILKLRVEINKLKLKSKSKSKQSEEKEKEKEIKDIPYNTTDDMLNQCFACDQCNKTLSQCHLYYCVLCNGKHQQDTQNRKYYCKSHLLRYHKENQGCQDHCLQALNVINKNNFSDTSIIQLLTFDVELLEKKKRMALQDTETQLTQYLNDLQEKKIDFVHTVSTAGYMAPPIGQLIEECQKTMGWQSEVLFGLSASVAIATLVLNLGHGFWMWHKNEITGKELIGRSVMTVVKAPALCGSAFCGAVFGGTAACAAYDFGIIARSHFGMVSFLACAAGAAIASHYCCKMFDYLKDRFLSKGDDFEKKKQINEAFSFFQMIKDDDREAFIDKSNFEQNKQELDRKYRMFAKLYHPDRNGGSHEKFIELQIYYATLKAVLNCDLSQKQIKDFVSITLKALISN